MYITFFQVKVKCFALKPELRFVILLKSIDLHDCVLLKLLKESSNLYLLRPKLLNDMQFQFIFVYLNLMSIKTKNDLFTWENMMSYANKNDDVQNSRVP